MTLSTDRPLPQWLAMASLSLALAAALDAAALPAAYLIGPMVAAIGFGLNGAAIRMPRATFVGAQAIIGCLVAQAITGSILVSIAENWMSMLLAVATTVVASAVVGWLLVRFGSLPGSTAAWGSSPGAASAMVAMAEEFGADPRLVAFMQYLRVIFVVLAASLVSRLWLGVGQAGAAPASVAGPVGAGQILPFLGTLAVAAFGTAVGLKTRIPAGGLLAPMALGALLHASGFMPIVLPAWLVHLAYAGLGWYIGLRFTREALVHALRALPQMLLSTVVLIGLCGVSAAMLTWLLDTDALTAYLATSPGGLDSVTVIAVGSRADVPFVLALQTLRLVVVILVGPALARLIARSA